MFCNTCGQRVEAGQKFCTNCGSSLAGITDATESMIETAADTGAETDTTAASLKEAGGGTLPATESLTITTAPDVPANFRADSGADLDAALRAAGVDDDSLPKPDASSLAEGLPDLGALPTREMRVREPIPDPSWAVPVDDTIPAAPATPPASADPTVTAPDGPGRFALPDLSETSDMSDATTRLPESQFAEPDPGTSVMDVITPGAASGPTSGVFDGSSQLHEFPEPREPFTFKLVFVFAFFGAITVLLSAIADVIDIRTSVPVDGIATGIRTLDTLGTNLAVAAFFGSTVMAFGGLLACFGFRWGAGLAGGAGLALVGWAALVIGLAELRIASAESVTRQTTDVAFTLRITRDLGFWLIVAVAAIGLLVFFASLRSFGTGGRPALNPWVAALGAVAGVVLAAGPLLPEGNATFANNFRSATTALDLPTQYFAGRLVQLGLIGVTIVFGLLIVRSYGLGLAAGGVSVAVWMWLSSLLEVGSFPLGVGAGNFGAGDGLPHAVTTVGMALTLLMLLVAAVLATIGSARHRAQNRQ